MSDPDYGTDIRTVGLDLDPDFGLVSGPEAMAQAQAHRLQTPEGSLFYDAAYESIDLRDALSAALDGPGVYQLRAKVERALRADERVEDCDVDVEFSPVSQVLTVVAEGLGAGGPFRLVVAATEANTAILAAGARDA